MLDAIARPHESMPDVPNRTSHQVSSAAAPLFPLFLGFCAQLLLSRMHALPLTCVGPVCSARKHPISVSLQSILSKHFPAETDQRRDEETEEVNHGPCVLPLFVVDYVLPGQVSRTCEAVAIHKPEHCLALAGVGFECLRTALSLDDSTVPGWRPALRHAWGRPACSRWHQRDRMRGGNPGQQTAP